MKRIIILLVLGTSCTAPPSHAAATQPATSVQDAEDDSRLNEETFEGLELRNLGPALMSGRIADIAIHPEDPSTWFVAVGSGNVWKTTNSGTTWTPIFDDEGSYSIGCVTIDPTSPEVIWIGTGENVAGRHVGFGDGVYKSLDGGASWERTGLEDSQHIGMIVVDPSNSDVVYVASQGPAWSAGGERGLFKTSDGGRTWKQMLSLGEYTGVNEVVLDPRHPETLYASTYQHYRTVAALINGGPESGIHKSTDGGETWRKLTNGLPEEDMGRIGLALSPQDPDVVYATIELANRKGGFYRSADGGASWEKRNDYISGGTGPHYYQELFASPHRFDRVYQADVWMHVTEDGGKTFREVGEKNKHSDNHALAFHPTDPDYLLAGCDGGIYESFDLGATWKFAANLPVTQFYKVAVDDSEPFYNVYGGTQDNSTQGGPSRTDSANGIRNADWFITVFADGHQPAVEPGNPDIVYSEWQEGNLVRTDRRTGEIVYIQPQPAADEPWDRFNWDSPILISLHNPARLYYASQRVWRSDDRGDSWEAISGDLSRGTDRLREPMMGRVQSVDAVWDLWAMSKYGTISSLAESPQVEGLVYAGTDDGLIHMTDDGGRSWRKAGSLPGVPEGFFVNDLKADLFDADTVYACVDNHKAGDFTPYLFKSTDRGGTWTSIVSNLPERHLVWRLVQDHVRSDLLFLGTEFGVFFTVDGGGRWTKLGGGVPNIPFRDLAIQRREDDLVGATFGRGFFILDDYSALREVSEDSLAAGEQLFPVRDAKWYVPRMTLGGPGKASMGDSYFMAENPPFGAVFTYHLAEEMKTSGDARRERESEVAKEGGDTPTPGWDAVLAEEREQAPSVILTVSNAAGRIVRRLEGPVTAGFHRVAWDLRYPSVEPWTRGDAEEDYFGGGEGFLAAPGTYTVSMAKRVDGRLIDLGHSQSFDVVPMRQGTLPGASPAAVAAFQRELETVQRTAVGAVAAVAELLERVGAIQEVLMRSTVGGTELGDNARSLQARLRDMQLTLNGSERRANAGDPGPVSIARRLDVAMMGNRWSTYGPTPTHRRSLEIAGQLLTGLTRDLDGIVSDELPSLEAKLDAAGVPWTPGRSAAPRESGR